MRNDIREKMNNWAFQTKSLMDELRNDPSNDAAFCSKQLSSAYENLNMQLGNQWGIKLNPVALKVEVEPVVDAPEDAPLVHKNVFGQARKQK